MDRHCLTGRKCIQTDRTTIHPFRILVSVIDINDRDGFGLAICFTDGYPEGMIIMDDEPDAPPADATEPSFDYSCEMCGTELVYGGRGRKPRFCAEHKTGSKVQPTGKGRKTNVDTLVNQIQDMHRMIGSALMFYPPTALDGMVLSDNADKLGASWKSLLERDAKVREMWEKFFQVSGYGAVFGAYAFSLILPIAQNHRLIPSPNRAAQPVSPDAGVQNPNFGFSQSFDEMGET